MDFENFFKNSDNCVFVSQEEIMRYMGCEKCDDKKIDLLCKKAENEIKNVLECRSVWKYLKIKKITDEAIDFGFSSVNSKALANHLRDCEFAVFAVFTIGSKTDMLIKRYSVSEMSFALSLNSAGTAFIEAYCDYVTDFIQRETSDFFLTPRFSPGYSDLDLSFQKDIFSYLAASKNIGVYLNESYMMTPSKSVCAIMGLTKNKLRKCDNKCALCKNLKCDFRKGKTENENNG